MDTGRATAPPGSNTLALPHGLQPDIELDPFDGRTSYPLHAADSNTWRETTVGPEAATDHVRDRPDTALQAQVVANILANGTINVHNDVQTEEWHGEVEAPLEDNEMMVAALDPQSDGTGDQGVSSGPHGFARLVFADGDYIITTHDVTLGRDMDYAVHHRRLKRREENERQAQEAAQAELNRYRKEPSQPSQTVEGGRRGQASISSQSEGRPAPPSNFSESGGAVAYVDNELPPRITGKKRRNLQYSKSSTSNTSVAPASLHPNMMGDRTNSELFGEDGEPHHRTLAHLPIHPNQSEDIKKISKEHAMFSFNFAAEQWELHVLGNRAFVNGELHDKCSIVPLDHDDEIQIATVNIVFKLPDNHQGSAGLSHGRLSRSNSHSGAEDESEGEQPEGVPTTQPLPPSEVMVLDEEDDDDNHDNDDESDDESDHPLVKKKSAASKRSRRRKTGKTPVAKTKAPRGNPKAEVKMAPKLKLKTPREKEPVEEPEPETTKTVGKKTKPNAGAKKASRQDTEEVGKGKAPEVAPPCPEPIIAIEPGSVLESVPREELPQKRKGPGRPPKNGLLSKRDMSLVKRKQRDYEKMGRPVPEYSVIVDMVRAETKEKERLAKLAASGQLPPGAEVTSSIETDMVAGAAKAPPQSAPDTGADNQATADFAGPAARVKCPRPRHNSRSRSLSPIKPEAEYSEEELKKPSATYVHILDQILSAHPVGYADLQELYELVQKRYPFFKYRAPTTGWQSSIRHNLLSNDRFTESGRSGKGKLWVINHDFPLIQEKKRRPMSPVRSMQMQNGPHVPGHHDNPYATGSSNVSHAGNAGAPTTNGAPCTQNGPQAPSQAQNPGQAAPQQQAPSGPFATLIQEILQYRAEYLSQFEAGSDIQTTKGEFLHSVTVYFSDLLHQGTTDKTPPECNSDDELTAYKRMEELFGRYKRPACSADEASGEPNADAKGGATADSEARSDNTATPNFEEQSVGAAVADGAAVQNTNGELSPNAKGAETLGDSTHPAGEGVSRKKRPAEDDTALSPPRAKYARLDGGPVGADAPDAASSLLPQPAPAVTMTQQPGAAVQNANAAETLAGSTNPAGEGISRKKRAAEDDTALSPPRAKYARLDGGPASARPWNAPEVASSSLPQSAPAVALAQQHGAAVPNAKAAETLAGSTNAAGEGSSRKKRPAEEDASVAPPRAKYARVDDYAGPVFVQASGALQAVSSLPPHSAPPATMAQQPCVARLPNGIPSGPHAAAMTQAEVPRPSLAPHRAPYAVSKATEAIDLTSPVQSRTQAPGVIDLTSPVNPRTELPPRRPELHGTDAPGG